MNGFLVAGLCLAASGCLVALLDRWCRRAPLHDLTRPAEFVDQSERQPSGPRAVNNELAAERFRVRWVAGGHNVRPLPIKPDPVQLHGWEDDGGAPA